MAPKNLKLEFFLVQLDQIPNLKLKISNFEFN